MHSDWVVSVSFGELMLKGRNRSYFVNNAVRHVMLAVKQIPIKRTYFQIGKFFLEVEEKDLDRTVAQVRKAFGLAYVTPARKVGPDMASISAVAKEMAEEKMQRIQAETGKETVSFKVATKRADKNFPMKSPEISAQLGGNLLEAFPALSVDVHDPDFILHVDIRDDAFVYTDQVEGMGGLPWGSGGKGLLLLSGGIDSPVAGFEIARRGMALGAIHFHSYPFTSERAQDKALRLAEKMTESVGPVKVFMVNLLDTYKAVREECSTRNTTVLSRRMMMRIGEALADRYSYDCFITGESLGQVASQTIQGITVVNDAASRPILRPLIARDKNDIIRVARDLGTYEISIEPYDDCCSIFAPDSPNTKPKLEDILEEEKRLDISALIDRAMESLEIIDLSE